MIILILRLNKINYGNLVVKIPIDLHCKTWVGDANYISEITKRTATFTRDISKRSAQ